MAEGSDKYVSVEKIIHNSWADETEETMTEAVKPSKAAWGTFPPKVADAPDLATILAEEEQAKKVEAAIKKQTKTTKPPQQGPSYEIEKYPASSGSSIDYRSSSSAPAPPSRPSGPRERLPVPTEPPFTAFIGNLDYDVTEEDLKTFFGPMGAVSFRLMKEAASGKQRGYGYVEFETAAGLEEALTYTQKNLEIFKNRTINIDVAKPPKQWGPPRKREEREGRDYDNSNNREKRDLTWGPSNKDSKSASGFGTGTTTRPPTTRPTSSLSERPKLNLNPPSQQHQQQPKQETKPKSENPFGAAVNVDYEKMDRIDKERLEKVKEKEDALKKKQEERRREMEQKELHRRPLTTRDFPTDSWRTGGGPKASGSSLSPRREEGSKTERKHRSPPVVDSEGFREQNTRSTNRFDPLSVAALTSSAARAAQNESLKHQQTKQPPKEIPKKEEPPAMSTQQKIDKQQQYNIYAGLGEEDI